MISQNVNLAMRMGGKRERKGGGGGGGPGEIHKQTSARRGSSANT